MHPHKQKTTHSKSRLEEEKEKEKLEAELTEEESLQNTHETAKSLANLIGMSLDFDWKDRGSSKAKKVKKNEVVTSPANEVYKTNTEQKFCYCKQDHSGKMVKCSDKECVNQWFHFTPYKCVEYDDKKFKGKRWYCTECNQKRRQPKAKKTLLTNAFKESEKKCEESDLDDFDFSKTKRKKPYTREETSPRRKKPKLQAHKLPTYTKKNRRQTSVNEDVSPLKTTEEDSVAVRRAASNIPEKNVTKPYEVRRKNEPISYRAAFQGVKKKDAKLLSDEAKNHHSQLNLPAFVETGTHQVLNDDEYQDILTDEDNEREQEIAINVDIKKGKLHQIPSTVNTKTHCVRKEFSVKNKDYMHDQKHEGVKEYFEDSEQILTDEDNTREQEIAERIELKRRMNRDRNLNPEHFRNQKDKLQNVPRPTLASQQLQHDQSEKAFSPKKSGAKLGSDRTPKQHLETEDNSILFPEEDSEEIVNPLKSPEPKKTQEVPKETVSPITKKTRTQTTNDGPVKFLDKLRNKFTSPKKGPDDVSIGKETKRSFKHLIKDFRSPLKSNNDPLKCSSKPIPSPELDFDTSFTEEESDVNKILKAKNIDLTELQKQIDQKRILIGKIPPETMTKYVDLQSKNPKLKFGWGKLINDEMSKEGMGCSFQSQGYDRKKCKSQEIFNASIRGYCNAQGCRNNNVNFKGTLMWPATDKPGQLTLEKFGESPIVQTDVSGRHLNGVAREEALAATKTQKPLTLFGKTMNLLQPANFLHKNREIRNVHVIHQAVYKQNKAEKIEKTTLINDLEEVHKKQKNDTRFQGKQVLSAGFLQRVSVIPLEIVLYCPAQVEYAALSDQLFLDATGSIVQQPTEASKRVLLHALVAKVSSSNASAVPVLEFLSNRNETPDIEANLLKFRSEVLKINKNWKPNVITVDFSFPYLHAVSHVFNKQTLMDHINLCYDNAVNKDSVPFQNTRIAICVAHVMHAFSRNASKNNIPSKIRQCSLHSLANILLASNEDEFKNAVTSAITLYGSEHLNKEVLDTLVDELQDPTVTSTAESAKDFNLTLKSDIDMDNVSLDEDKHLQRDKSKYYKYFKSRQEEIAAKIHTFNYTESNPLYSPETLNILGERYMPYYPLWGLYAGKFPGGNKTSSNAPVERYIGIHKNILHPKLKMYAPQHALDHGPVVVGLVNTALQNMIQAKKRTEIEKEKPITSSPMFEENPQSSTQLSGRSQRQNRSEEYPHGTEGWAKDKQRNTPKYLTRNKKRTTVFKRNRRTMKDKTETEILISSFKKVPRKKLFSSIAASAKNANVMEIPEMTEEEKKYESSVQHIKDYQKHIFKVGNFIGDEIDVASLAPSRWVTDAIINQYASLLFEGRESKTEVLVPSQVLVHLVVNRQNQWGLNDNYLPGPEKFDFQNGKLYIPSHSINHWFLMVADFKEKAVFIYDSAYKRKIVDKEDHTTNLFRMFERKYGVSCDDWMIFNHPVPQQKGSHECGPMTLMFLRSILNDDSTDFSDVDSLKSDDFRAEIATELLQTTANGRFLLKHDPIEVILDRFLTKEHYRSLLKTYESATSKNMSKEDKTKWLENFLGVYAAALSS